jgi:hypothetical protein
MFEDLGVSAYNGAGALLTGAEHVAAVGTLVERHTMTIVQSA